MEFSPQGGNGMARTSSDGQACVLLSTEGIASLLYYHGWSQISNTDADGRRLGRAYLKIRRTGAANRLHIHAAHAALKRDALPADKLRRAGEASREAGVGHRARRCRTRPRRGCARRPCHSSPPR